jgi:hypothetical protein
MLIRREVLERIRAGEITLQFRRWRRRTVKPGGTLKTKVGVLAIGDIRPAEAEEVDDADARRAGFADAAAFRAWLGTMKPGTLERIEVAYAGEDPRAALREADDLSAEALDAVAATLDGWDRRADIGPWTGRFLDLIARNEGRLAEELAHEAGLEKRPFKARVRRLKALGLTESLAVGYRLSPRGRAVHRHRSR